MKKKVVVGMSGGVDSSVAAYLLKEEGYEVIGITMVIIPDYVKCGRERTESIVRDAKKVAEILDIEHHIVDLREDFQKEVIDRFAEDYLNGRTPNPCVICNGKIKFGRLGEIARDLGADYFVTGHYGNVVWDEESSRYLLMKGSDPAKDQSYFLYDIKKEDLSNLLLPLRDKTKDEIREIAKKISIDISRKSDSEEICFIPDDDHSRFIREDLKETSEAGNFVDPHGNILGQHEGIINYTIGQRKGLGIALGRRVYVKDILAKTNEVVLGDEEDLYRTSLYADELNLISIDELPEEMEVKAKIRYRSKESKAKVRPYKDGMLVEFEQPQRAITRGQSVVLYDGNIVVGGGIIREIL